MLDNSIDLSNLLALPKIAHNWSGFQKRNNHVGSVIGSAQLSDMNNIFLPGITLEIEVKAPIVTARCLLLFTLMRRQGLARRRVVQLEVCPTDKRSHNGITTIYGPHFHIGDDEPTAVSENGVNCEDWDGSLGWFLNRVNVYPFAIEKSC
jgi:hypothetical protein